MEPSTSRYIFPDLSAPWPAPAIQNADSAAAQIVSDSSKWISEVYSLSAQPAWKAAFNKCDFGLLTMFGYPLARGGHLRACADWLNYTFTFDDYFEHMKPEDMEREAEVVMSAFENPHTPSENDSFLTRLTREFWANVVDHSHPSDSSAKRFVSLYRDYLKAVMQEVKDRNTEHVRTLDEHIALRRGTAGAGPVFVIGSLPDDIPDEIFNHPSVQELTLLAMDIVGIANDMLSFNREQSIGQSHNAVTSALYDRKCGIQDAFDHTYCLYTEWVTSFLAKKATLPAFPHPYDELIAKYLASVEHMLTGYIEWGILTPRYFDDSQKKPGQPIVVEMSVVKAVSLEEWFEPACTNHECCLVES